MEFLIGLLCGGVGGYVATRVVMRVRLDRQRKKEHEAWTRQMQRLRAQSMHAEEKK